jgi:replicative DNA helicase
MADLEQEMISSLMLTRDFTVVSKFAITDEHFFDPTHAKVFTWIREHHQQYGEVPTPSMLKRNWPTYDLIRVEHNGDYYGAELRQQLMHQYLIDTTADLQDAITDRDPEAGYLALARNLELMAPIASGMTDEDLTQTWEARIERYRIARNQKGFLRGLSTGFESIDRVTLGMAGGQFWVLVGLPKTGKSTILLAFAIAVHNHNRRPLFIGFEMTNEEQSTRHDSQLAHVDSLDLMSGRMSREDERLLLSALEPREAMAPFLVSSDVQSATTVSGIAAKIDEHRPDAVFIDGLYMMDDESGEPKGSSAALTNITRGLARLTRLKDIPIIGTTQVLASKVTRSFGITSSSVGYSSSFHQDCHVLVAVEANDTTEDMQTLKLLGNRSGPKVDIDILWEWDTSTFEEIVPVDV